MKYEKESDLDTNLRIDLLVSLGIQNTLRLKKFAHLPRDKKVSGRKRDHTRVTLCDYQTNIHTLEQYLELFPDDTFDGEEVHMLRRGSRFTVFEDPIDGTDHALLFDPKDRERKNWSTYMLTLVRGSHPVGFFLGVPHRNQSYHGSLHGGIFLNGNRYVIPSTSPKLVIWLNEEEQSKEIEKLTGKKEVRIAGMCAWLILQGATAGGACPFHLPHESACIAAIAACAGAHICNIHEEPFQPYNEEAPLIWSFDKTKITSICNWARTLRR